MRNLLIVTLSQNQRQEDIVVTSFNGNFNVFPVFSINNRHSGWIAMPGVGFTLIWRTIARFIKSIHAPT
jgi:hypothetical protein